MKRKFLYGATVAMGAPANSPFPLNTTDYRASADLLKGLGYESMEVHIRAPELVDGPKIKAYCDEIGMVISTIGTGQAYGMEGLSITSPDADVRKRAVQRLKDQLDLSAVFAGAPIIIGSMRGIVGKERTFKEVNDLMIDSMKELADYAEKTNTEIVIEAIDRFESDYLQRGEEVLALIDEVGSDRVKVHLDTYHMNLEEHLSQAQYRHLLKVAAKEGCNYFTFNIPNTICNDCGCIDKRYLKECPHCHSKNVDYMTRIIGYLKRVSNFSLDRQKEAARRFYAKVKQDA